MSEEAAVAADLNAALEHLRADRPAPAIPLLDSVQGALAESPDLADIRARACSLLAQARLATGAYDEARVSCHEAMRIAKRLGDDEGLAEVRALDEQIAAELDRARRGRAAVARAEPLASQSLETIEAEAQGALSAADALLKHAGALRLVGRDHDASQSARRAVHHADQIHAVREQVLARIALAESTPAEAKPALLEALKIADSADETTLIGLVARAAELAGVELPRHYGPLHGENP